jgi:hypothetical protein
LDVEAKAKIATIIRRIVGKNAKAVLDCSNIS